jgi:D-methionine transport system permease protein
MVLTVTILVAMVQVIQFAGNTAARRLDKRG